MAMRLHTKDQAPKEGGQKAAEQPFPKVPRCCSLQRHALQHYMLLVVSSSSTMRIVHIWLELLHLMQC